MLRRRTADQWCGWVVRSTSSIPQVPVAGQARDPFLRRPLRRVALVGARAFAIGFIAITVAVYAHLLPDWANLRLADARASSGPDAALVEALAWVGIATTILAAIGWTAAGLFILWRRSRDLFGILLAMGWVSFGLITDPTVFAPAIARSDSWAPFSVDVFLIADVFAVASTFVFPDGRFVPRGMVGLALLWAAYCLARILSPAAEPSALGPLGALLLLGIPASAVVALIYRMLRSDVVQREQLKWIVYGGTVLIVVWAIDLSVRVLLPATSSGAVLKLVTAAAHGLSSIVLVSAGLIAIFRQGLFDIDVLINRTAAYGAITAILIGVFIALNSVLQGALSAVAGGRSDLIGLVAALAVALGFVPLRSRLLTVADRFISDRRVLTFLFLDITGSTATAAAIGDRAYRELLNRFRTIVREQLKRYGGREIDTAGDGFFAVFEGPGRAIRSAIAIVGAVRPLGVTVRIGLHIGECEVQGNSVIGIGVVIGQRVMSNAGPNEVLVSRTLRDLVAGSDLRLEDRGTSVLKGVPGEWQLFAVEAP